MLIPTKQSIRTPATSGISRKAPWCMWAETFSLGAKKSTKRSVGILAISLDPRAGCKEAGWIKRPDHTLITSHCLFVVWIYLISLLFSYDRDGHVCSSCDDDCAHVVDDNDDGEREQSRKKRTAGIYNSSTKLT